ncbi:S8 family serine peptidase [Aliifodinibius sp. S!AR15-10]|uniref:S8 family serine peptidase n=1 Tax=Aliifodinibius sp. S!AR15-10 TaxID=2950437 RepID=UPI00285829DF|nr:S8 family serine peptidase [Aliifodinibius sp. S!AR15-10]MDR8390653.1 S8 family serine peptidase [Aliifodinibius sp. S!AR15-10]
MKQNLYLLLFIILLTCSAPGNLNAQNSKPHYLPHTLVIKYENSQKMNNIRQKQGTDPRNKIQQFLSRFGASNPKPIWSERSTAAIKRKSQRNIDNRKATQAANELQRIHKVHYVADVDAAWLAAKVSRLPGVEYAEPKYLRFLQNAPTNDPIENPYEEFHRFTEAWDETTGSSDVIIAIIDTGVDYNHPDLDDKLWTNDDEIADNGVDDDNNGKIDDVIGWDFWDSGTPSKGIMEDNDPMMDVNDHGTHVAGIAAAETNNGEGLAGTGYNSRYMAVKAGGVPESPNVIGFGFEGIVYAAQNGADIINCSWGGPGFSQAERDAIDFAASVGAVVLGASGNEGRAQVIYPAAFDEVVAVGSVESGTNSVAQYSNFGIELDVLATGSSIESTEGNNQYGTKSGTSMSTPVVSGLAALLRSLHPEWTGRRIASQIRASSAPLLNTILLGRGKIDAYRAVTTSLPGVEVANVDFLNQEGEKLSFGESGQINVTLVNHGAATSSFNLTASALNSSGIEVGSPNAQPGAIPTGDTVQVTVPIQISSDFDLRQTPAFQLEWTDSPNNYIDFDVARYSDLLFDVMAENRVKMSISADGSIGFTDPLTQQGGIGFIPREQIQSGEFTDGENLLFEGGLMLQFNGTLHDAVRSEDGELSRDFNPQSTFRLQKESPQTDLLGTTHFTSDTVNNLSADIKLTSYAYEDPALSNVVYLLYEITNPYSYFEFEELYAGIFNDWDIGASSSNNGTSYSQQDSILYVYDQDSESTQPVVAVASVGPLSSAFAIDNAATGQGLNFGLYDGYTDAEKKQSLTAGTTKTNISGTDVSAVIASGPYTVGANATLKVGFVYAFGEDSDELRSQIQQARSQKPFQVSEKGRVLPDDAPDDTEFFQNYPNPFNGSTRIRLDLSQQSHVNISLYNVLGRKVAEIVDNQLDPRIHIFNVNASRLSSGIYFARLQTDTRSETIKLVLVK